MPIAFLLKLAGVAESLWRLLRSAVAWVFSDLRHVAIAVLLTGCAYWYFNASGLKAENTELRETLAKVEEAQKLATKLAKEEKARIEAQYKEIANAKDADIRNRIAAAVARVRDQANSSGKTNLPSVTETAINPDGAGQGAVVDDAEICTINTIKAQGWQDWYMSLPKDRD